MRDVIMAALGVKTSREMGEKARRSGSETINFSILVPSRRFTALLSVATWLGQHGGAGRRKFHRLAPNAVPSRGPGT
jgi:hypothetical protein